MNNLIRFIIVVGSGVFSFFMLHFLINNYFVSIPYGVICSIIFLWLTKKIEFQENNA